MQRRHRRTVNALLLLLVLYCAVGGIVWRRAGGELYPIFTWDLFSVVPNTMVDYGLRVTHLGGQPLAQPRYFEEATDLFPQAQSIVANASIQNLGLAVERQDQQAVERLVRSIGDQYLNGQPVRYKLVKRVWHPLDRYHGRGYLSEQVLAAFGSPPPSEGAQP